MHAADVAIDITEVDSSAMYPLGQEFYSPATSQASVTTSKPAANTGPRVWVYVFNDDTPAFAAGEIIMRDVTTGTIPAIRVLGVAQHAIAAGSYGWILKRGLGELAVVDTAEDQANDPMVSDAGGRADVMAAGEEHEVIAFATENAAATAGALLTAWINCPG